MNDALLAQQRAYAELIIRSGVNVQPGQCILVRAELGHRDFVRLLAEAAYAAGARHMEVMWVDPLVNRTRLRDVSAEYLGWVPDFEVARGHEALNDNWARISLTGSEYPDALEDVDPVKLRTYRQGVQEKLNFMMEATMNNEIAWCVAAVPVKPWAEKVFSGLDGDDALERLWELVLRVCRADQPDPQAAWRQHDANLKQVSAFLTDNQVRSLHFLDERLAVDGKPSTDLRVGLTDHPNWPTGSSVNAAGAPFLANIPTEEVFSTPHNQRTEGWVRTSKPGFSFQREISGAYFRFEQGEVVEWRADKGQDVLDELFKLSGARRLGEVALVDVRSPINRSGLLFFDTLFDENAACHIAFGRGYPEGIEGGHTMSKEELAAAGLNASDAHEDLMIGSETMTVTGLCADGREVVIMRDGMFVM